MLSPATRLLAITALVALTTFTTSAAAARRHNRAPTISGTPVTTVAVASTYVFQPTAYDADRNALTFSIANKPVWATFDTNTGTLYGTPDDASVGNHTNILISVSDGEATSSLPAFTITVSLPASRTATLNWAPPTQNMDGSPITNLSGYKVMYGSSPGQYSQTLSLPVATMTSVVIEGLEAGSTWYFTVKAVNASGVESNFSNEVSKLL